MKKEDYYKFLLLYIKMGGTNYYQTERSIK